MLQMGFSTRHDNKTQVLKNVLKSLNNVWDYLGSDMSVSKVKVPGLVGWPPDMAVSKVKILGPVN